MLRIRPARSDDLASLVEIERAAGETFRPLGMGLVADDDPGSVEELLPYAGAGRAFVAAGAGDRPVGYLLLDVVDGAAHVEQVSVHPDHARQGIGRRLVDRAAAWAAAHGLPALTLTTYVDVPWNGPYYERLGFRRLGPGEETPALRAIRERERRAGLDAWPRASMSRTTVLSDDDLYRRGAETLVASWEEYARGAAGAAVRRLPGVAAAVFPDEPERGVYNNALLERGLGAAARARALDVMEAAYAAGGVTRFAAWAHEGDGPLRRELERRGYALDSSTRAMAMPLEEVRVPRPELDLAPPDWLEYLRIVGVPPDFLARADPGAYHVLVARLDGESVAAAMAFDHEGDCGIYNVGTLEHARRRGLGTALTALHLHEALERGCRTASLQATPTAERLYAAVGFRDLGRILEYVPPG